MKKYVELVNKTFMKGENLIKLMGLNKLFIVQDPILKLSDYSC